MRLLAGLLLLPSLAVAVIHGPSFAAVPLLDGTTYTNVHVVSVNATGARLMHANGVAVVPWSSVSALWQTNLGFQSAAMVTNTVTPAPELPAARPRIGATVQDFLQSAGRLIPDSKRTASLGATCLTFNRGAYLFVATFWKGHCHKLEVIDHEAVKIRRQDDRYLYSNLREASGYYGEMIGAVLNANTENWSWVEETTLNDGHRRWHRTDNRVDAVYVGGGSLTLETRKYHEAIVAEDQASASASLRGL